MKKVRFTVIQIINIHKFADLGLKVEEICRQNGISNATFYNWKAKYGGMGANGVKRLKELEDENTRLKSCLLTVAGLSVITACELASLSRASFYRCSADWWEKDKAVIDSIQTILSESPQAGFWKCYYHLRFKGYSFNHIRVYRVYCRLGLNLKRRVKKTLPEREKKPLSVVNKPNIQWAMDFMHDALYCGK